ncbi:MAG: alpha/beta fold hydrolase [Betaproteobacteria bacterium]|nr:MAG: alpha/beta fold hydrolase [Betaproteobacteria bacterium]
MSGKLATWAVALLFLLGGCVRMPDTGVTTLKTETPDKLERQLLDVRADVEQFRPRGPFKFNVQEDHELLISPTERIEADVYLSVHPGPAPLVVFLHGSGRSKEDHAYQAVHLATWGMHSISVQLPGEGPWIRNGRTLARIVSFIRRRPEAVDRRIDPNKIVLVGYSFGGAAVAIALAEGAVAAGAVLLDPAGIGKALPTYLRKVRKPVMIIASDPKVNVMRQRGDFYRYISSDVAQISIRGAHHDDAMFPLESGLFETSNANEAHQITFVAALTATVFGLASTGKLDYAWGSFGEALKRGKMVDARRKPPK